MEISFSSFFYFSFYYLRLKRNGYFLGEIKEKKHNQHPATDRGAKTNERE